MSGLLAMDDTSVRIGTSAAMFLLVGGAVFAGSQTVARLILRQERKYEEVLQRQLLMTIRPRTVTLASAAAVLALALLFYALTRSWLGAVLGAALGGWAPTAILWLLRKRRMDLLEQQLVAGVRTLASGVRAGLNLVQSMQLLAHDGPAPLRQEIAHLLREYEYGVPLEEAMDNAAARIGSGDYVLLFSALQTHRERGGDLGETLDRIGDSIREIQRLENRVKTLTAEGRATARWLGLLPPVVLGILYMIHREGVIALFSEDLGKLIILAIVALNVIGFLLIRKILNVDI